MTLSRQGLQELAAQALEGFVALDPRERSRSWGYVLRATSGTSSGGALVALQEVDARTFRAAYERASRAVICFGSIYPRLTHGVYLAHLPEGRAVRELPLGGRDAHPALGEALADFGPDAIIGAPSLIVNLSAGMPAPAAAGVRSLLLSGERLSAEFEERLRRVYPNAELRMEYVSVEAGRIGHQPCGLLPANRYHPVEGAQIDIADPDEQGHGEILVSKTINPGGAFERRIEKYRTGDVGRAAAQRCPCGREAAFECVGRRGYDYIKLAGALLRREEFDRVASRLGAFDDYRARASRVLAGDKVLGRVVLEIYRKDGVGTPALAREIAQRFSGEAYLTPTRTLENLVAEGLFLPLEVRFADRPFPVKNKDIKLIEAAG